MGLQFDDPSMPALTSTSAWFEIRLFYIRISPCVADDLPNHLTLRFPRHEIGVALEINGDRFATSQPASLSLRRDRVDKEASEVTYVTTDSVRVSGSLEFEVYGDDAVMVLCGSLEGLEMRWSLECFGAVQERCSTFCQPKKGVWSPSIEVHVAGWCSGAAVVLTKMVQVSPRRKVGRESLLDAIPEAENEEEDKSARSGAFQFQKTKVQDEPEPGEYIVNGKYEYMRYGDGMCTGEDGQLSCFNAGVRVGVGIGLGVCIGAGIGVGLLMRSYQATTQKLTRKFF